MTFVAENAPDRWRGSSFSPHFVARTAQAMLPRGVFKGNMQQYARGSSMRREMNLRISCSSELTSFYGSTACLRGSHPSVLNYTDVAQGIDHMNFLAAAVIASQGGDMKAVAWNITRKTK